VSCVLLLSLLAGTPAGMQTLSVPVLKAAFLYSLVKFTEWPADAMAPAASLEFCIIGDPDVADALDTLTKGRMIGDHPLTVRRVKREGALRHCHLLYGSGLGRRDWLAVLDAVKGSTVLTIADDPGFAELGGVASIFFEDDKIRFSINLAATHRARVVLSSQLLAMAKIVKDQLIAATPSR
jgi:hypothetical protein